MRPWRALAPCSPCSCRFPRRRSFSPSKNATRAAVSLRSSSILSCAARSDFASSASKRFCSRSICSSFRCASKAVGEGPKFNNTVRSGVESLHRKLSVPFAGRSGQKLPQRDFGGAADLGLDILLVEVAADELGFLPLRRTKGLDDALHLATKILFDVFVSRLLRSRRSPCCSFEGWPKGAGFLEGFAHHLDDPFASLFCFEAARLFALDGKAERFFFLAQRGSEQAQLRPVRVHLIAVALNLLHQLLTDLVEAAIGIQGNLLADADTFEQLVLLALQRIGSLTDRRHLQSSAVGLSRGAFPQLGQLYGKLLLTQLQGRLLQPRDVHALALKVADEYLALCGVDSVFVPFQALVGLLCPLRSLGLGRPLRTRSTLEDPRHPLLIRALRKKAKPCSSKQQNAKLCHENRHLAFHRAQRA
eukprot:scaffold1373_cov367-Pinguiococcus_pyrenoidosus.AAC.29